MNRRYPYLMAGLPALTDVTDAKNFDLTAIRDDVAALFSDTDRDALQWLFLPFDNRNLAALLQNAGTWSPYGNFPETALASGMEHPEDLPAYMTGFLDCYSGRDGSHPEMLHSQHPEDDLAVFFYRDALQHPSPFIRGWFAFDMELKNVTAALTARRNGMDIRTVGDGDVQDAIRSSSAADFGLRQQRTWVGPLLQLMEEKDLIKRELQLDLLQWEQLDEMTALHDFDSISILAWMQKAIMVQRRLNWNAETGQALFRQWIADTRNSFDMRQILTA